MEDEPKGGRLRPSSPEDSSPQVGQGGQASAEGPGENAKDVATRRASVFPSIAPPAGPSYRIVFALLWVAIQAALVVTADRRSDGAFGFRMFNESSTLELALFREVDAPDGGRGRIRVHVEGGVWSARASDGTYHRLSWYDRVPSPYWIFDQEMHASYGAATQLERLQGAIDDVVSHLATSDDLETRRLLLDVKVRRNGREPVLHHLTSRERVLPSTAARDSRDSRDGEP